MIWGIGIDIVQIKRMSDSPTKLEALAKRVLTEEELQQFSNSNFPHRFLAKRFAAKEAVVKAIGTGIGNGIGWQQIEIAHDQLGKPLVKTQGALADWCADNKVTNIHISISDEADYAVANAMVEVA